PLVVGSSGSGANGQSVTPFIEIPTSRNEFESTGEGGSMANTTSASSALAGGSAGFQSVLNNTVLSNATP
ncbi:MAG: hypothetical protein ACRD4J_12605, partial [Nitrososphaeraceae archaeon]